VAATPNGRPVKPAERSSLTPNILVPQSTWKSVASAICARATTAAGSAIKQDEKCMSSRMSSTNSRPTLLLTSSDTDPATDLVVSPLKNQDALWNSDLPATKGASSVTGPRMLDFTVMSLRRKRVPVGLFINTKQARQNPIRSGDTPEYNYPLPKHRGVPGAGHGQSHAAHRRTGAPMSTSSITRHAGPTERHTPPPAGVDDLPWMDLAPPPCGLGNYT
jgi:hypothetical protein